MATHLRTELVLDAMNMAVWQRRPQQVIHHSDQGTQYTSIALSFFASLACELIDRQKFRTQAEAKMAVFDYIEGFYNPRRRHASIGQISTSSDAMQPDRARALFYSPLCGGSS